MALIINDVQVKGYYGYSYYTSYGYGYGYDYYNAQSYYGEENESIKKHFLKKLFSRDK